MNTLKYRLQYNTFKGEKQTQHFYTIQFSDDGNEWFDLEDEFPENIGHLIIKALESANLTYYDELRPNWTDNTD